MNIGIKNIFKTPLKRFVPIITATAIVSGTLMASTTNKEPVSTEDIHTEYSLPQRIIHPKDGTIYIKNYHPDLININTNRLIAQPAKLSQLYRKVH